ncbi:replication origin binding protein [Lithospermum erythrorhizon]|uniref:Origin recognition complex subunit 1 n=1 Tax=Lithospermum erythrorhizon TaxID=34254 RepID=A0AAV3NSC3_LITER
MASSAFNTPKSNKSPSQIRKKNNKSPSSDPHLLPSTPLPAETTPLRRSCRLSTPSSTTPPPSRTGKSKNSAIELTLVTKPAIKSSIDENPFPKSAIKSSIEETPIHTSAIKSQIEENPDEKSAIEGTPDHKFPRNVTPSLSKRKKSLSKNGEAEDAIFMSPVSPDRTETRKKRKLTEERNRNLGSIVRNTRNGSKDKATNVGKKRVYYRKVEYDGGEFAVGDDVYVKRREDASSDNEDPEVEECRVCFRSDGRGIMLECDNCLGGFHLKCLKPPLKEVPEGDWICGFCEAKKSGKEIELPKPPKGRKRARTAKEKLLTSDLYAAHIESIWKEVDGSYWFQARWYMIPEETAAGRQPHNLRRELYRTNDYADAEMESIIRHCFVMNPKDFSKAGNEGDDVFLCEYEYDIHWHSFKRIANIDEVGEEDASEDDSASSCTEFESDTDDDCEFEKENKSARELFPAHPVAANSRKGRFFGLQKIGVKKIPEHVRSHKQTELEKAKATLLLASLPKSLPCRDKEMEEITAFIKDAICENQCLGRCLYIHGVPGTGKTMSVLSVMRNLRSEVDAGSTKPYCFVEINGLKLASPENIYSVIYEALSGHKVGWKKALHFLNERFSSETRCRKEENQPCVLLIDELDLLVTRNQSVLYNILDWPTKPHSNLVVIGIANTMDLPEKLLPRISSRMGIHRLCFGPYTYQQLQEIISSRLKGIVAFEKPAIEFASRKVAAVSGDARRALEICRRAAEFADYRAKKELPSSDSATTGNALVGMRDIDAAIKEMFQAPHIQVMMNCSKLSKIFLTAMVYELYKTGMGETTFEKLATAVSCICTSNGEQFPGWDALLKIGCKLGECRILLCEPGARHKLQKLQLNFPSDDVTFALKDSRELPWLAKYL